MSNAISSELVTKRGEVEQFLSGVELAKISPIAPRLVSETTYAEPSAPPAKAVSDVLILGTRGIPAAHGGFETFAQQLSLYLKHRGWNPSVYCQADDIGDGKGVTEDTWEGVNRILIPSRDSGSVASITYDLRCVLDARNRPGKILLLGYNTAVFATLLSKRGRDIMINMDGLEWQRPKWSRMARCWLWMNEKIAARLSTTMVADHPEIKSHLVRFAPPAKVVMIPYGAPAISQAEEAPLGKLGLTPRSFYVCISRIEPENSQLDLVTAFAASPRKQKLVMLGRLDPNNAYHRAVQEAAGPDVLFPGPIYDKVVLDSLRFHSAAYVHGHTVGGTNPSLVEALGAGCAVIAHDNKFNRWTAGVGQHYFRDVASCKAVFDFVGENPAALDAAREAARMQHRTNFELDEVLGRYERLIGFELQTYCEMPRASALGFARPVSQ